MGKKVGKIVGGGREGVHEVTSETDRITYKKSFNVVNTPGNIFGGGVQRREYSL